MHTTPVSLLERLRESGEADAWSEFVALYTPLVYGWARRIGLQPDDAADLVQEVFTVLVQKLPAFEYDPHGTFRGWLRTVTLNKWLEQQRRRRTPEQFPTDGASLAEQIPAADCDAFWETEYRQYLANRALELMRSRFQPTTWRACWEHVVEGRPAADVAAGLGISVDSVYAATSRVLRQLRSLLGGLME